MHGHDDFCDLLLDCYLGISKVINREWWEMHAMPCPCHGFVTWRLLLRRGAGHFAPSGDSRDAAIWRWLAGRAIRNTASDHPLCRKIARIRRDKAGENR